MFDGLIDGRIADYISASKEADGVTELRMRVGRPLVAITVDGKFKVKNALGGYYTVTREDIDKVLAVASDFSIYSINEEIIRGFVPRGGVRIGVAGEGVTENGKLITVKNISFLVIRIPHQIRGAADPLRSKVFGDGIKNTLIISPPGAGKTTVLRELARISSERCNTLIIDERQEIAFTVNGVPRLDVGDCDVISAVGKTVAYENAVRSMNPEVIVTDEIFAPGEVSAVADIIRSGVKVFASVHGESVEKLQKSAVFSPLFDVFEVAAVLAKKPTVGTLKEVVPL